MTHDQSVTQEQFNTFQNEMKDFKNEMSEFKSEMREFCREIRIGFLGLQTDLNNFKTQTHENFQDMKIDIREVKTNAYQEKQKIDELYKNRESIAIKFSKKWGLATLSLSVITSGIITGLILSLTS